MGMKVVLLVQLLTLALVLVNADEKNIVIRWSEENLFNIQLNTGFLSPPAVGRALALVNTCMYDAWTAYDSRSMPFFTTGITKRSSSNVAAILTSVSFAARCCIRDIFCNKPASLVHVDQFFMSLGYSANDSNMDQMTPQGLGNYVCAAVVAHFAHDGFNAKADEPGTRIDQGAYTDYTNYFSVNDPQQTPARTNCSALRDIGHWQPLRVPRKTGGSGVQRFLAPHLGSAKPFAMNNASHFRPSSPPLYGTNTQDQFLTEAEELISIQASLTDREKVIAEFWADGPDSTLPPGHWQSIAIEVAMHSGYSIRDTIFVLTLQALAVYDAGIAVWDAKRYYDTSRPITIIQCLFEHTTINGWLGPYMGNGPITGSNWVPYQSPYQLTPAFAEFPSGHSGFSFASAEVLKLFTGMDGYTTSHTIRAGNSLFEPKITAGNPGYVAGLTDVPNSGSGSPGYSPANDITLCWTTFSERAAEAGQSRLYGGIHFRSGNLQSQALGKKVGDLVFQKARMYFNQF